MRQNLRKCTWFIVAYYLQRAYKCLLIKRVQYMYKKDSTLKGYAPFYFTISLFILPTFSSLQYN